MSLIPGSARFGYRSTAWVLLYCAVVLIVYRDTVASMVQVWLGGETFTHGFLIAPISAWLIWRQRDVLAATSSQPQFSVLLLTIPVGLIWLIAYLVNVQLVQHLCLVALLAIGIWGCLGSARARKVFFPLSFLFLAVPMGQSLIPPLMEFTATGTVWLLKLTGIPVFREGMYFSLPTGNWSVVAACSGVRYLIASFTLGVLYAYLTYSSWWRRGLFVLAAVVVPILANVLRAYGIVMLGHLSNMELAVGVDHLIYGWLFFGVIMLLLFWLGGFWQEPIPDEEPGIPRSKLTGESPRLAVAVFSVVILVTAWPVVAGVLSARNEATSQLVLSTPIPASGWTLATANPWSWRPAERDADHRLEQIYSRQQPVGLYLMQYVRQQQGRELVGLGRYWIDSPKKSPWRIVSSRQFTPVFQDLGATEAGEGWMVEEMQIDAAGLPQEPKLLAWSWYRLADHHTANPYMVKFWEAWEKLTFGRVDGARIFLATPLNNDLKSARQRLSRFFKQHQAAIEEALDASGRVDQ